MGSVRAKEVDLHLFSTLSFHLPFKKTQGTEQGANKRNTGETVTCLKTLSWQISCGGQTPTKFFVCPDTSLSCFCRENQIKTIAA